MMLRELVVLFCLSFLQPEVTKGLEIDYLGSALALLLVGLEVPQASNLVSLSKSSHKNNVLMIIETEEKTYVR